MRHPDISVIVVNWNTCELLEACLKSVYNLENDNLKSRKNKQEILLKNLGEMGYSICRIINDHDLQPIENIEAHSDLSLSNYLFFPNSSKQKLIEIFNFF